MKWNGILTLLAFVGWACLCGYQHKQLTNYKGMYESLNGDVQVVFGNERPSEESLANVKKTIQAYAEANEKRYEMENELLRLRQAEKHFIEDREYLTISLKNARQQIRLLQTELEVLSKKMD